MKLNKALIISLCLVGLTSCDNGVSSSSNLNSLNDSSSQTSNADSSSLDSSSLDTASSSSQSSVSTSSVDSSSTSSDILPTSISTNFKRTIIGIDEELKIDVIFTPSNVTAKNLRFKSSDPSTIKIDSTSGVLKGVASSKNYVTIIISSLDNTKVKPITLSLKCSSSSKEVENDKMIVLLKEAMKNEEDNIVSGTINIVSQTASSEEKTFTNNFESYKDHTYNNINDYNSSSYLDYVGFDDNYLYKVKYDDSKTVLNSSKNQIIDDDQTSPFSSTVKRSKAKSNSRLACLLPFHYSSSHIYGISNYLEEEFITPIFDKYQCDISSENGLMKISYKGESGIYKDIYSLEVSFENSNFKTVSYTHYEYSYSALDEDYNVIDSAKPSSYEIFTANLNSGIKGEDTKEDKILPSSFYFDNYSLKFYNSKDLENPSLSFYRGDTIVYKLDEYSPNEAIQTIDRIYVDSVSNENVLSIAVNKLALNAVGEGDCDVVLKSTKYTYKVSLHVDIKQASDIKISTIQESMLNTDYQLFSVDVEPFGAYNDLQVSISEGSEFASLEYVESLKMYKLIGNSSMTASKGEVTIVVESKSNKELHKEIKVTVMRALTSEELFEVLTTHKYKSTNNSSYYNYYTELEFGASLEEGKGYKGSYVIYKKNGSVFATFTFYYSISNGKLNIISSTCDPSSYCKDLKITLNTPSALSLYTQFTDTCTDGEDDYSVTFTLNAISEE